MTSALTKLSPHCPHPHCLAPASDANHLATINGLRTGVERVDFVYLDDPTAPRTVTCWNCGKDYTARFYERQGEEL